MSFALRRVEAQVHTRDHEGLVPSGPDAHHGIPPGALQGGDAEPMVARLGDVHAQRGEDGRATAAAVSS
jgi:hypothetical protein